MLKKDIIPDTIIRKRIAYFETVTIHRAIDQNMLYWDYALLIG